jgi:hypothetical protein
MKTPGYGWLHRASAGFEITLKYCAPKINATKPRLSSWQAFRNINALAAISAEGMPECTVINKSTVKLLRVFGVREKLPGSGGQSYRFSEFLERNFKRCVWQESHRASGVSARNLLY